MSLKKKFLLFTFAMVAALAPLAIYAAMQVRATAVEQAKTLPGDDLIPSLWVRSIMPSLFIGRRTMSGSGWRRMVQKQGTPKRAGLQL